MRLRHWRSWRRCGRGSGCSWRGGRHGRCGGRRRRRHGCVRSRRRACELQRAADGVQLLRGCIGVATLVVAHYAARCGGPHKGAWRLLLLLCCPACRKGWGSKRREHRRRLSSSGRRPCRGASPWQPLQQVGVAPGRLRVVRPGVAGRPGRAAPLVCLPQVREAPLSVLRAVRGSHWSAARSRPRDAAGEQREGFVQDPVQPVRPVAAAAAAAAPSCHQLASPHCRRPRPDAPGPASVEPEISACQGPKPAGGERPGGMVQGGALGTQAGRGLLADRLGGSRGPFRARLTQRPLAHPPPCRWSANSPLR